MFWYRKQVEHLKFDSYSVVSTNILIILFIILRNEIML